MNRCFTRDTRKTARLRVLALLLLGSGMAVTQASAWGQGQKTISKPDASESATPSKQADTSAAGNAENGKRVFMSDGCYECHGTVGQGSTSTGGARIGPPAISFEVMLLYVRHPSGQMPPYTDKVISDHDLADIYAYLKSQPKPPAAKDIPLLRP